MATLNSPGVQVQVIDESFYTPSAPGTVPMIFVASGQDKTNPSGTTALGTTAANAGKIWLMTGQRDLTDTFGTPKFYTDASSNPLHGNELHEYGLQAAYSLLSVSSRAYVVRADLNTTELIPTDTIPSGTPVNGTYWLDTDASLFGINEYNSATGKFTAITPIVLDDNSPSSQLTRGDGTATPTAAVGNAGDYCIVISDATSSNQLYFKSGGTWATVYSTFDGGKDVQISPSYTYPTFAVDKSVWIITNPVTNGANWKLKRYNSTTKTWDTVSAPIYADLPIATGTFDSAGGKNIAVGTLFVEPDTPNLLYPKIANFRVWRKSTLGVTSITNNTAPATAPRGTQYRFKIRETLANSKVWGAEHMVSFLAPSDADVNVASLIPDAIGQTSGIVNITATYNDTTKKITITHKLGGDFQLDDYLDSPLAGAGFSTTTPNLYAISETAGATTWTWVATTWKPLEYYSTADVPTTAPDDGRLWYNSIHDEVDVMYHDGSNWQAYGLAFPDTDPSGPIVAATEPTTQRDGTTALATNDIWISTADMERYGKDIYLYNGSKWILQDTTDQTTPDGWLFADVRWAATGEASTAATITALRSTDYVDPDAPDPAIYPRGMRLINTRRSGFNVKKYMAGYIDLTVQNTRYQDEHMEGYNPDRWVSQHSVAEDGSGVFGRMAQRAQVIAALKSTIDTNQLIRDTDTVVFNLIAAPGYPEAIQNMIAYNTDRGITAFVVGDTPFRLAPTGTALTAWGLNTNNAFDNGDDGATSYDEYMAMYYPSGYTNDNTGNKIVVPPSHMMLRTIINSDAKSFQWFAPAGTRRGGVDNATSVGYITSEGEFKTVALHQGLRDVLDDVKINPIATLTGVGLLAYGQRTRAKNASSLDRINVARLVCYLRRQLDILARPFLFEPNDAQTRREIKAAAESLMTELVGQRALYDFVVVCDETNNTPARIDRSELYMDIAIEPVKAVEFIYIPLRLKNTGDIKAGL